MSVFTDLAVRLRALLLRHRDEQEMDEEIRDHFERDIAERVRRGATEEDARRQAVLAFGFVEEYREQVRDARGTRPLEDLVADIRYAARGLRRNPGFTLTAVLVLSLGLGATATMYGIMHAVVLADLPYPQSDRLVRVFEQNAPTNRWSLSTADVLAIRDQQHSFAAWGMVQRASVAVSGSGGPERISAGRASAGYFEALGVPVAHGRSILPDDERVDAPAVMIIANAFAERRFGSARAALGESLSLDGVTHTVVGVLPAGRDDLGGLTAAAWPALRLSAPTRRGPFWLSGIGRLRPGVDFAEATRDLASISAGLLPAWSDFRDSTARLTPYPLRDVIVGSADRQVALFAAAVAALLLLVIVNVANLVLTRATGREHELAVRQLLGAGRRRIARQLATENGVLTLLAALPGLALASVGTRLAMRYLPDLPRVQEVSFDGRVIVVGLCAALLTGLVVSISPVLALARRDALAGHARGRRGGTGIRDQRLRAAFVVAQFAIAWPLLVTSGLLAGSVTQLERVDHGFDARGLVSVSATLPPARYPGPGDVQRFWTLASQRVAALPGVSAVGLTSQAPPDRSGGTDNFNLESRPVASGQAEPVSPWYFVSPEYFDALGIRVVDGRGFTAADSATSDPVVVVSQSWARRYFGASSPVGERLVQGGCYNCPRTTVIGVVEDIRNLGASLPADAVYGPMAQSAMRSMFVVARTGSPSALEIASIRDALQRLDPDLPLAAATLSDRLAASLDEPRRWASILAAFSIIGLTLAAVGIAGLMAYTVRQQQRDIGVRLALGADQSRITRDIVTRGVRLLAIGSAVGIAVTLVLTGRLRDLLFGISPTDAATYAITGGLLLGAAVAACWIPARRAARVDPAITIRSE